MIRGPLRVAHVPLEQLGGWWTATVATITPYLSVTIPHLSSTVGMHTECRSAVFSLALAVGDPVFVAALDGQREVFVICARRVT